MTKQEKKSLYRELAQIFVVSQWDFEAAFDEIIKILARYGFERCKQE